MLINVFVVGITTYSLLHVRSYTLCYYYHCVIVAQIKQYSVLISLISDTWSIDHTEIRRFLWLWRSVGACSACAAGRPGIAVPPGTAH